MMNNNRRATLARIGRERAERRRCPRCNRGGAMSRIRSADGLIVARRCRYCQHEIVRAVST